MSCKCGFIDTINVFYDVVNGEHMSRHFLRTNPDKWTIVEIVEYLNLTKRKRKCKARWAYVQFVKLCRFSSAYRQNNLLNITKCFNKLICIDE